MATAGELATQMQDLKDQYSSLGTFDRGQVYGDLIGRVDSFRPQYEELAGIEQQAYAAPAEVMQGYYDQFGTVPGQGPSAMARLSGVLNQVGNLYGRADVLGNVIDVQRGRLGDLVSDVGQQVADQRQSLMNQYSMLTPRYENANRRISELENQAFQQAQFDYQREQAAREFAEQQRQFDQQMALQRDQFNFQKSKASGGGSRGGGGGSIFGGSPFGMPTQGQQIPTQRWADIVADYKQSPDINYLRDIKKAEADGTLRIIYD
jgi:hypothetical protein